MGWLGTAAVLEWCSDRIWGLLGAYSSRKAAYLLRSSITVYTFAVSVWKMFGEQLKLGRGSQMESPRSVRPIQLVQKVLEPVTRTLMTSKTENSWRARMRMENLLTQMYAHGRIATLFGGDLPLIFKVGFLQHPAKSWPSHTRTPRKEPRPRKSRRTSSAFNQR